MNPLVMTVEDEVTIAALAGEVDAANADGLRVELERASEHLPDGLVIDLTDVTYIDSAGIHALFTLSRRLHERSRRVLLVVAHGSPVEDTLRYADALGLIGAEPTRAEAVGRLRERAI